MTKTIFNIRTQTFSIYRFKLIWVVQKIAPHLWPLRTQQMVSLILQANFRWNNLEPFSVGRGKRFPIRPVGLYRLETVRKSNLYIEHLLYPTAVLYIRSINSFMILSCFYFLEYRFLVLDIISKVMMFVMNYSMMVKVYYLTKS